MAFRHISLPIQLFCFVFENVKTVAPLGVPFMLYAFAVIPFHSHLSMIVLIAFGWGYLLISHSYKV